VIKSAQERRRSVAHTFEPVAGRQPVFAADPTSSVALDLKNPTTWQLRALIADAGGGQQLSCVMGGSGWATTSEDDRITQSARIQRNRSVCPPKGVRRVLGGMGVGAPGRMVLPLSSTRRRLPTIGGDA
jgi:hypothetical protein